MVRTDTLAPVPADPVELADRLCDEFEQGWLAGCPAPLEDVVRSAPEADQPGLFRDLLAIEEEYRAMAGRPLTPAEAVARHPHYPREGHLYV